MSERKLCSGPLTSDEQEQGYMKRTSRKRNQKKAEAFVLKEQLQCNLLSSKPRSSYYEDSDSQDEYFDDYAYDDSGYEDTTFPSKEPEVRYLNK